MPCAAECADFDWTDDGPDYGFLRYLGHRIAAVMSDQDRTWAISQVIEVEAPDAAANAAPRDGRPARPDAAQARAERACHR